MTVRAIRVLVLVLALAGIAPVAGFAQTIAGTVHNGSGAVLPGVTIVAESAALLEKVRTVVSDGTGQYRIEHLRPGIYTVSFTQAGFRPYVREEVEISSAFTVTVDAQLAQGSMAETIVVTAAAPVVDVRSADAAYTLRGDEVKARSNERRASVTRRPDGRRPIDRQLGDELRR